VQRGPDDIGGGGVVRRGPEGVHQRDGNDVDPMAEDRCGVDLMAHAGTVATVWTRWQWRWSARRRHGLGGGGDGWGGAGMDTTASKKAGENLAS
jgi:hypothetical protein